MEGLEDNCWRMGEFKLRVDVNLGVFEKIGRKSMERWGEMEGGGRGRGMVKRVWV